MSLQVPEKIDLSKYIDTQLMGDRPHIRERRLPVSFLAANAATNGWNIQELAYEFTLSEEQVLAALLYYREYMAQIDAQDTSEQQLWDQQHDEFHKSP